MKMTELYIEYINDILSMVPIETPEKEKIVNVIKLDINKYEKELSRNFESEKIELLKDNWKYKMLKIERLKKETIALSKLAFSENIVSINLKGLTLKLQAYNDNEERYFGDIDILIKIDDLENYLSILVKRKYLYVDESDHNNEAKIISTENIIKIASENKIHHFIFYNPLKNVYLELHLSFCEDRIFDLKYEINDVFLNAKTIRYFKTNLFVLGYDYNVFHILLHYIAHSYHFISNIYREGFSYYPPINILYDLASFIEKNKDNISWEKVIELIILSKSCSKFLLAIRATNEIFDNIIPKYIEKAAFDHAKYESDVLNRNYFYFSDLKIIDLYLFDNKILDNKVKDKLLLINTQKIECHLLSIINRNTSFIVPLDINNIVIINSSIKNNNFISLPNKLTGNLNWDKEGLIIKAEILVDKTVGFKFTKFIYPNIQIRIGSNYVNNIYPIFRNIYILPNKNKMNTCNEKQLIITEDLNSKEIIQSIDYDVEKKQNYLKFAVYIPWKFLNIRPCNNLEIPFDILIHYNNLDVSYTLPLFLKPNPNWWEYTNFGYLVIEKGNDYERKN